jgi:hypothetical protein
VDDPMSDGCNSARHLVEGRDGVGVTVLADDRQLEARRPGVDDENRAETV